MAFSAPQATPLEDEHLFGSFELVIGDEVEREDKRHYTQPNEGQRVNEIPEPPASHVRLKEPEAKPKKQREHTAEKVFKTLAGHHIKNPNEVVAEMSKWERESLVSHAHEAEIKNFQKIFNSLYRQHDPDLFAAIVLDEEMLSEALVEQNIQSSRELHVYGCRLLEAMHDQHTQNSPEAKTIVEDTRKKLFHFHQERLREMQISFDDEQRQMAC